MKYCIRTLLISVALTSPTLADSWPHWRGPNRNDHSAENSGWTGDRWALGEASWSRRVGEGSTSPLIIDGQLYTLGYANGRDTLVCLDAASGNELWKQSYECPRFGRHATGDQGLYAGITSTPEYDPQTGLLYTLSVDGDLICWNARGKGKQVWHKNLYDEYEMPQRPRVNRSGRRDYGYTTSPLVHEDWLIVEAGGKAGNLVAFDKRTGQQVWASKSKDLAGHTGGPVPIIVEGVPCVVVLTFSNLLVTRLDGERAGQTVAEFPWQTEWANNITTPAVQENFVLVTSGYNHRAMCKLRISLDGAKQEWERPLFSKICTPIIHQNRIYWASNNLHCVDFETGQPIWQGPRTGDAGSCILTADERLITWAGRGDLLLSETTGRSPGKYQELARKSRLSRTDVWPHIVLANNRLFCKDRGGNLFCLPIGGSSRPLASGTPKPTSPMPVARAEPEIKLTSWPGDAPGLIGSWQSGQGPNLLAPAANSNPQTRFTLEPRGNARLDSRGAIELAGGAMLVRDADERLLAACRASNELSIEVVLASRHDRQRGPARMVSFSTDGYQRNFSLAQEKNRLLLRLRTPRTGTNGMRPETELCTLEAGRKYHLIVSYRDGELVCYRDGQPVLRRTNVGGDFSNWTRQHLLLGDEWQGNSSRDWQGHLHRVALHSRFMGPKEARRRNELVQAGE